MNTKQLKAQIESLIENGYAETHVGYHAEYRMWNNGWRRGCYAQIAAPYGSGYRIYADSYAELLIVVQERRPAAKALPTE